MRTLFAKPNRIVAAAAALVPFFLAGIAAGQDKELTCSYYDGLLPGELTFHIEEQQCGGYGSGEPMIIKAVLTNVSDHVIDACEHCVSEGIRVKALQPRGPICGFFADHVRDYRPQAVRLEPGQSITQSVDLAAQPCPPVLEGTYRVTAKYCYTDPSRKHGVDPPTYCIRADSLELELGTRQGMK